VSATEKRWGLGVGRPIVQDSQSVSADFCEKLDGIMAKQFRSPDFLDHLARRGAGSIHPLGRAGTEVVLDFLSIEDGESVLEVGCGTGETLVRMAAGGVHPLRGLDISESMVECARRRCAFCRVQDRVEILWVSEGSAWPVESATLDGVVAESVMAILERGVRRHVLEEIARVLKPGGRFLLLDSFWRRGVQRETISECNSRCCEEFGIPQATEDWVGPGAWNRELGGVGLTPVFEGLLADLPQRASVLPRPVERTLLRSRLFSFGVRARAMLSPAFFVRDLRFNKAILCHRDIGRLIEPRLVIAHRV